MAVCLRINVLLAGLSVLGGCAYFRQDGASPESAVVLPTVENPMFVPVTDQEFVWNQIVDEIDDYFKISREQRVRLVGNVMTEGRVETFPRVGATLLEPWRRDSTPGFERQLATLQSIRRTALVRVVPTSGGYLLDVAVQRELEDVIKPEHASGGAATLRHDNAIDRDREDSPVPDGSVGWIPLGRDVSLEQRILTNLRARVTEPTPAH